MTPTTPTTTALTTGLVAAAKPTIQDHEGRRLHVYPDGLGIPTIALGFNLQRPDARALCAKCGADYDALLAGTADLTEEQCDFLYEQLAIDTLEWLAAIFPAFFTYSQSRQIALLDQGYTLGETRFRAFRQEISAILQGNWAEAAAQMLDSKWHSEAKARCVSDANRLIVG